MKDSTDAMTLARQMLADGDCTLVVAKDGVAKKFYQRGVADLVELLDGDSEFLEGGSIADKVVGKAAASLMIEGCVAEVYSAVMTHDAKAMFALAGIPATYGTLTDMVVNRTKTGRCPLDTICAPLTEIPAMTAAIRNFVNQHRAN